MEQTLESYIAALTRNIRLTNEWYESYAVLCNENEVEMLLASLAPVSMIQFSLCLKDIDFDHLPNSLGTPEEIIERMNSMKSISDQKRESDIKLLEIEEKMSEQEGNMSSMKQEILNSSLEKQSELQKQIDSMKGALDDYRSAQEQIKQLHKGAPCGHIRQHGYRCSRPYTQGVPLRTQSSQFLFHNLYTKELRTKPDFHEISFCNK